VPQGRSGRYVVVKIRDLTRTGTSTSRSSSHLDSVLTAHRNTPLFILTELHKYVNINSYSSRYNEKVRERLAANKHISHRSHMERYGEDACLAYSCRNLTKQTSVAAALHSGDTAFETRSD
jgi:hypothetical protein